MWSLVSLTDPALPVLSPQSPEASRGAQRVVGEADGLRPAGARREARGGAGGAGVARGALRPSEQGEVAGDRRERRLQHVGLAARLRSCSPRRWTPRNRAGSMPSFLRYVTMPESCSLIDSSVLSLVCGS